MRITVLVRRADVRFTWECGCWVAFKKPPDLALLMPPFYDIDSDDGFDPWTITDPLGLEWCSEMSCKLQTHGGSGVYPEFRQYRLSDCGPRPPPGPHDAVLFSAAFAAYAREEVDTFSFEQEEEAQGG